MRLISALTLALALGLWLADSETASAAPPYPFVGHWQGDDPDGSFEQISLAGNGAFILRDSFTSSDICGGSFTEPGPAVVVTGTIELTGVNTFDVNVTSAVCAGGVPSNPPATLTGFTFAEGGAGHCNDTLFGVGILFARAGC